MFRPATRHRIAEATGLPHGVLWAAYFSFWLVGGLLLAIAELQHYLRRSGPHPWEPFLWELSSVAVTSLLMLGIFQWHERLVTRHRSVAAWVGGHLLGLAVYTTLHVAGMYAIRWAVYGLADVGYHPGDAWFVLRFEAAKDATYYALFVLLCQAMLMFLREHERRREWERLNQELAQARLARLQEQVQPHFLFNTLNLVSSVMYEDVERADRILSELADLLRRTLEAGRQTTHSLDAELALVEPFLSIMRQRFADRLRVGVQASGEARRCEVPSLLLIAPLENAVKHGAAASTGPTEVRVDARVAHGVLEITVSDSAGQLARQERPGGIGLQNTRERLRALHGDAADMHLASEGGFTVLRLRLPAKTAA